MAMIDLKIIMHATMAMPIARLAMMTLAMKITTNTTMMILLSVDCCHIFPCHWFAQGCCHNSLFAAAAAATTAP